MKLKFLLKWAAGSFLLSAPLQCLAAGFGDPDADREALPTVPQGFEVSFFAREPMVRQPCSMAFDAKGRLCVGMGPQYRQPTPDTPGDSVVLVIDSDGDGRADQSKVFATGFNAIQGLAWRGRDLWVANAPDLTIVRDLDGDDEADQYIRVYSDLGNLEHGLHGLNWAPDGRLYMSKGNSKGLTLPGRIAPKPFRDLWGVAAPPGTPDFPPPEVFTRGGYRRTFHDPEDDWGREGGILRCEDLGRNLEIFSRGFRNPWDICMDDGFNWIGTDNDQTGGDRVFMAFSGANFGWNHPWNSQWGDSDSPSSAPVSGPLFEGSGTGVVYCDSPAFPVHFRGSFLINDWLQKTTYLWRPEWDGALMRPKGTWQPFVVGGSSLFRPTDLEFGPDGSLYILGWSSGYGAEYKNGEMKSEGRVFRITWKEFGRVGNTKPPARRSRPLPTWTVEELVEDLAGPLPVWKTDAQEELVRRGTSVQPALMAVLADQSKPDSTRTWAAWTLGRMDISNRELDRLFLAQLRPDSPLGLNLRIQSIRILPERFKRASISVDPLLTAFEGLLADSEPRIRHAALDAISSFAKHSCVPSLLKLLSVEKDRLVRYVAWQSLRKLAPLEDLKTFLKHDSPQVRSAALLALLEDHRLDVDSVRNLSGDADTLVRTIASNWLSKVNAGGEKLVVRGRPLGTIPTANGSQSPTPPPPLFSPPSVPARIEEVMAALQKGNRDRGEKLFLDPAGAGCFNCHRLKNHGNSFGPDLSNIASRSTATHIVESMLNPNAVITEGFKQQMVQTGEGEFSGVLLEESGLNVTLGLASGERRVFPKARITGRRSLATSAMPEYASALGIQEFADLAAFLMTPVSDPQTAPAHSDISRSSPGFSIHASEDRLLITYSGKPVGDFVFRDPRILRPYFSKLRTPDGLQVTRNHPPVPGFDAVDHDTMHPGIWYGFGDINGVDFWRNKGRIEHGRWLGEPRLDSEGLSFGFESRWIGPGDKLIGLCGNQIQFIRLSNAWLLSWEIQLTAGHEGLKFGDQEEMGFGARVATQLTEKSGGLIRSSAGLATARSTWGMPAAWCDYSGMQDGKHSGILLMTDPSNFRPSWWHNRDYGVFVANPFGRQAMKQGPTSEVVVPPGERIRLRFGAVLHGGDGFEPVKAYETFLRLH